MRYAGRTTVPSAVFLVDEADRNVRFGEGLPLNRLPLPSPAAITSIEDLAASLLTELQRAQPFGPYFLLGKALGGLVAYELASQLLGRDEPVGFLGLIDCPKPRNLPLRRRSRERVIALAERYCPEPLPIPLYYFVSDLRSELEITRAWRALVGDSLRVVGCGGALTADVLVDAIAKAPRQEFLQCAVDQEAYSPLVTLQVGVSREAPMIFVPGAGGSATACMSLAQSLRKTTVHSLQPRGFDGIAVPHRTVQAAAAVYLRAIRRAQPCGPYRLVGHSFGGWIVFELACRLAAEGEHLDPIVLIDTEAPAPAHAAPRHLGRVAALTKLIGVLEETSEQSMNLTCAELAGLDYEAQLTRLAQEMKALGLLPRSGDVNDIRGMVRVFEVNLNTHYVPATRFPGCAMLLQPAEHWNGTERLEGGCAPETREAWRTYVGHLECASMPGNHMTMLRKPHVEAIAGHLSRLWSASAGSETRLPRSPPLGASP